MTKNKIQKLISNLHWYVLIHDFNAKEITRYDIFANLKFKNALIKLVKPGSKLIPDYKDFSEQLKHQLRYCFWAQCEYEILVAGWPPIDGRPEETKIDVYEQILLNYDCFAEYVYTQIFRDEG